MISTDVDIYGAEFKLDVGLYRLNQQVACQRYRQNRISANFFNRVANAFSGHFAFAPAFANFA